MKKLAIIAGLSMLLIQSCKKEEDLNSPIPRLSFVSISPNTVGEFRDSLVIRVNYRDGDGDLGENETEIPNAFVTDKRSNLVYEFRIRQLAPEYAKIAIEGNLDIVVPQVGLVNSTGGNESASFDVYVKDRAGNQSNTITTSAVTVIP